MEIGRITLKAAVTLAISLSFGHLEGMTEPDAGNSMIVRRTIVI